MVTNSALGCVFVKICKCTRQCASSAPQEFRQSIRSCPAIHAAVLLSNFYIPDSLGALLSGTGGDTFAPVLAHDTTEVG
jgi:hypothetical protein